MTKQQSKAELLKDIESEHRRLESTLAALTNKAMTRRGVVGDWSVKDILAHMSAWEQLFLSWYKSGLEEGIPSNSPVGMSRKAIDALNLEIFNQYQRTSLRDVLTQFQNSYQQILGIVHSISEEDMFTPGRYVWTDRWALVDYIAGNTCNHYRWARSKIHQWLKAQNRV